MFRVLLFCVVPQLPLSHMVPPEIIEYTPYSVAFAMLWIAATLTMTAKFLPSGALHHPLVILQHGCDSLGRFATAMAIHNNLETLEQTPCSMDIRVPPLTTAISTAMAKLRPSQCTRTPHLRCCDKGPPCRFDPEGSDNRTVPNRATCCTTLLHSAPLRPVRLRVLMAKILMAHAVGSVTVHLQRQDGTSHQLLIHNVVYHPEFSHNLLSVRRLWKDNDLKTRFGDKKILQVQEYPRKISICL